MVNPLNPEGFIWWSQGSTNVENFPYSSYFDLTEDRLSSTEPIIMVNDSVGKQLLFKASLEGSEKFCNTIDTISTRILNKHNQDKPEMRITTREVADVENIECDRCRNNIDNYIVEIYPKDNIFERVTIHLDCARQIRDEIKKCKKEIKESTFRNINEDLSIIIGSPMECKVCSEKLKERGYVLQGRKFQVCGGCIEKFLEKIRNSLEKHIYNVNYDTSLTCEVCDCNRSLKGKIVEIEIGENSINIHKCCADEILNNVSTEDAERIKQSYMVKGLLV